MSSFKFVFGIHNHQPVGNFEEVFEENYRRAYEPFLKTLYNHPSVKAVVHNSGPLLLWLEKNHPEYIEMLREMVKREQVEVWAGGFYEPILPAITSEDRVGQIKKMIEWIEEKFDFTPRGMWVAERVWEPGLVKDISLAGIEYIALDDTHFIMAGLSPSNIYGYYITEDQGYTLKVFPISKELRYVIPFKPMNMVKETFSSYTSSHQVVVFLDDGEKFGSWSGTYENVYQKGWLEEFFTYLTKEASFETALPMEIVEKIAPTSLIYLPTASYEEMMIWALPTEKRLRLESLLEKFSSTAPEVVEFLKGGHWRNFFYKYYESNHMAKKGVYLSRKIHALPPSDKKMKALDFLWRAQTNCPYWHGEFGGIYIKHLRRAVYQNLLNAERIYDEIKKLKGIKYEMADVYGEGAKISMFRSPDYTVSITNVGAQVVEWSLKKVPVNLQDVVSRKVEAYHEKIRKGEYRETLELDETASIHNIKKYAPPEVRAGLVYDWYRRYSFVDHFLEEDVTVYKMKENAYAELGNFVFARFTQEVKGNDSITYTKNGNIVWLSELEEKLPVELKKTYEFSERGMDVIYDIRIGEVPIKKVLFAVELNIVSTDPSKQYISVSGKRFSFEREGSFPSGGRVELVDEFLGWKLYISLPEHFEVWFYPIHTVSQDVDRYSLDHQGFSVLFVTRMDENWVNGKKFRFEVRYDEGQS